MKLMRKTNIIILLILAVIIIAGCSQRPICGNGNCEMGEEELCPQDCQTPTPTKKCHDTDNGQNIYQRGTTKGLDAYGNNPKDMAIYGDKCDGERLMEFYCKKNSVVMNNVPCEYGCQEGACLHEPSNEIDLSEYPEMYIKEGKFDGVIVIGRNAPSTDTIAAANVAMGLQESMYIEQEVCNDQNECKQRKVMTTKPEIKMDDEVTLGTNIISIGNPCNNQVTRKIMQTGDCNYKVNKENQGIIFAKKQKGYTHLVLYGAKEMDTIEASKVLQNHIRHELNRNPYYVKSDKCTDTDGGKNYNLQGVVTKGNTRNKDTCSNSGMLFEQYCKNGQPVQGTYNCPNGCNDGACVTEQQIEFWIKQGEMTKRTLEGKSYEIEMVDVTESGESCGLRVNGDFLALDIHEVQTINNLEVELVDAKAVQTEQMDADICRLKVKHNPDNTIDNAMLMDEGEYVDRSGHRIKMLDVSGDGEKCGFFVDKDFMWVQEGKTESLNGIEIHLREALDWNSETLLSDNCWFRFMEEEIDTVHSYTWLHEDNTPKVFNYSKKRYKVQLEAISNDAKMCKLRINDKATWFEKKQNRVFNGMNIWVEDIEQVHSTSTRSSCEVIMNATDMPTQHLNGTLLREDIPITVGESRVELTNANENGDACEFSVNQKRFWLQEGEGVSINGTYLYVFDSIPVFYPKDSDECRVHVRSTDTETTYNKGTYLSQQEALTISGFKLELAYITESKDNCGIRWRGNTYAIEVGDKKTFEIGGRQLNLQPVEAIKANAENMDEDVCRIKFS